MNKYAFGHAPAILKSHESRTAESTAAYLLPYLQPQFHLLDVGCGPGTISASFAQRLPQGRVTAVDASETVIERAKELAQGVENVHFEVQDAFNLTFPDNAFDVVHCHALLVHVPNASQVVAEMRRVCKPGGYVALKEIDWDTVTVYPDPTGHVATWFDVTRASMEARQADPTVGRRLRSIGLQVGFLVEHLHSTGTVLAYYAPAASRFWGKGNAERTQSGAIREFALSQGITEEELKNTAEALRAWGELPDASFTAITNELIAQK